MEVKEFKRIKNSILVPVVFLKVNKMFKQIILSSFLIIVIVDQVHCESRLSSLDDHCLRCICSASSECDPMVRCHTVGPIEYYCGPFQISERYWKIAGSPGLSKDDPMDFELCANDIECSIQTVRNFMSKNWRDCDRNHRITCADFAAIHKAGTKLCSNSKWLKHTKYWRDFERCAQASKLSI